jgi:hypothetical protein
MTMMSAIPNADQRVKRMRRCGVSSRPMPTAMRKKRIEGLLSSPMPAESPKMVHQKGCGAPSMRRMSANAQSIQKTGSKEFMERKPSRAM